VAPQQRLFRSYGQATQSQTASAPATRRVNLGNAASAPETVSVAAASPVALDTVNASVHGPVVNPGQAGLSAPAVKPSPVVSVALSAAAAPAPPLGAAPMNYVARAPVLITAAPTATAVQAQADSLASAATTEALAGAAAIRSVPNLPSHLPAIATAGGPRLTLALDAAGTVFRSEDAGVTWRPVMARWSGRAVQLAVAPSGPALPQNTAASTANPVRTAQTTFSLTTDEATTYTSPDGLTWTREGSKQ
jgi:hypothetical protein